MKIKKILLAIPAVAVGALFVMVGRYAWFPDVSRLSYANPQKTAFMIYRERERARRGITGQLSMTWVPIGGISPHLVHAVVMSEDDKFWDHDGFDREAIQKAFRKDFGARRFKLGASTITQQLAKNLYLNPSKNPLRKIEEAMVTRRLERALPKKRILEIYLNCIEWGDGIFGAENAARRFFGKSAADLTVEEAARLAAVLPNPLRYDPLSDRRFVVRRAKLLLQRMARRGIVPQKPDSAAGLLQTGLPAPADSGELPMPPDTAAVWATDTALDDSAAAF
jgi:monofunctional glycosyltransferase